MLGASDRNSTDYGTNGYSRDGNRGDSTTGRTRGHYPGGRLIARASPAFESMLPRSSRQNYGRTTGAVAC